jgi:hypothetical protein
MTNSFDSELDLDTGSSDPKMLRLISDLQQLATVTISTRRRSEIATYLSSRAHIDVEKSAQSVATPLALPREVTRPGPHVANHGIAKWLLSTAAALLLILGGGVGVLRLTSPGAVSAAQILKRAAVAFGNVPANQVVHETTIEHLVQQPGSPSIGDISSEQWTQVDSKGYPLQVDLTHTAANSVPGERLVADNQGNVWTYDPVGNSVTKGTWTPGTAFFQPPPASDPMSILFLAKQTMNAPQDPSVMRNLLQSASGGADGQMQILPQQTIDGIAYDVVQITRATTGGTARSAPDATSDVIIVFIDPSTYFIRRIEMKGVNDYGATVSDQTIDITRYEVMSPSDVPPGTFTFTPSPGTRVVNMKRQCLLSRGHAVPKKVGRSHPGSSGNGRPKIRPAIPSSATPGC